ncbi:MAG TPA: sugar metabolism transcriptional regulator [Thermodesulfobacteriaceae bacterium]|nr:sugar metabolism transcriptional regulator [Thermodesulfobacteriaceae bacterium]
MIMADPIALRQYLQKRKLVPLIDILNHFRLDKDVIEPMLELWIKKGKVKRHKGDAACRNACCKCDPASIEFYEWTG